MMRCLLPTLIMAGLLLACSEGTPSNMAPTGPSVRVARQDVVPAFAETQQTVVQLRATGPNFCTGENVDIEGPLHIEFHITQDAAGGLMLNGQANFEGVTGVGDTTGITYHIVGRSIKGFDGPFVAGAGGTLLFEELLDQGWVSEGSSANLFFRFHLLVVMNANGDITADIDRFEFLCRT